MGNGLTNYWRERRLAQKQLEVKNALLLVVIKLLASRPSSKTIFLHEKEEMVGIFTRR